MHAVSNWLSRNNLAQHRDSITAELREILQQPSFVSWQSKLEIFLDSWKALAPGFVAYFEKEWVANNKYLTWALHTRTPGIDTGDQKGEGYNYYLKAIPFAGLR